MEAGNGAFIVMKGVFILAKQERHMKKPKLPPIEKMKDLTLIKNDYIQLTPAPPEKGLTMEIQKLPKGPEYLKGFGIRRNIRAFEGDPHWQIWGFGYVLYL